MISVPKSGLEIGNPLYEWIQAAHWDNMSYEDFEKMPVSYKEMIIAARREEMTAQAVMYHKGRKK